MIGRPHNPASRNVDYLARGDNGYKSFAAPGWPLPNHGPSQTFGLAS